MSDEAARIAQHYAEEAREHLARDYGLVSLGCSEMLEIADLIASQQAEIARLRDALIGIEQDAANAIAFIEDTDVEARFVTIAHYARAALEVKP